MKKVTKLWQQEVKKEEKRIQQEKEAEEARLKRAEEAKKVKISMDSSLPEAESIIFVVESSESEHNKQIEFQKNN